MLKLEEKKRDLLCPLYCFFLEKLFAQHFMRDIVAKLHHLEIILTLISCFIYI